MLIDFTAECWFRRAGQLFFTILAVVFVTVFFGLIDGTGISLCVDVAAFLLSCFAVLFWHSDGVVWDVVRTPCDETLRLFGSGRIAVQPVVASGAAHAAPVALEFPISKGLIALL